MSLHSRFVYWILVTVVDECRPSANLQRDNLVAVESKDELKIGRAARETPGEPAGDDRLIVLLSRRQGLDRVLVFLLGLGLPPLDGVHPFECVAFVSHDGVFSKELGHGFRIAPIVGSDIASDRYWKIDGHFGFSCSVQVERASPALSRCLRSSLGVTLPKWQERTKKLDTYLKVRSVHGARRLPLTVSRAPSRFWK